MRHVLSGRNVNPMLLGISSGAQEINNRKSMMGGKNLPDQVAVGTATICGDPSLLKKLASTITEFKRRFEIMLRPKMRFFNVSLAVSVPQNDVVGHTDGRVSGDSAAPA